MSALTWGFRIRDFGPVELRNWGFLDCGPLELGISGDAAGVWNFLVAYREPAWDFPSPVHARTAGFKRNFAAF